jgi:hypothetical protein
MDLTSVARKADPSAVSTVYCWAVLRAAEWAARSGTRTAGLMAALLAVLMVDSTAAVKAVLMAAVSVASMVLM